MLNRLKDLFRKVDQRNITLGNNRQRFDSIISDKRFNYLENIYERLGKNDTTLTDTEILDSYFKFSASIQTNSIAAAELEWAAISVLCHFRPHLTEALIRKGLLAIVSSFGDNIDWYTVQQFIDQRILSDKITPYGGLPPEVGQQWLKDILPEKKESVQKVLDDVIKENRIELEKI